MLVAGEVVEVEVRNVEVFGIFCSHHDQEILVLIPDISWVACFNSCRQFAEPGDRFFVKILNVDSNTGKVAASLKALHPDPWVAGLLKLGAIHRARVVRRVEKADRCND